MIIFIIGEQTVAQVDDLDFQRYFFKMSACTNAGRGNPSKVVVVYPDCEPSITCREKSCKCLFYYFPSIYEYWLLQFIRL